MHQRNYAAQVVTRMEVQGGAARTQRYLERRSEAYGHAPPAASSNCFSVPSPFFFALSTMAAPLAVTFADVEAAARRIDGHARRTPVMTCHTLDALSGRHLHFKCENFQK